MYVIKLKSSPRSIVVKHVSRNIKLTQVGRKGATGEQGIPGATGSQGPAGATGATGAGVATGGTTGQILAKNSNTNFDTEWVDPATGDVITVNGQSGVVVLDSDDISDTSQTNKYVTAADKVKLSNLSGVNTGDQDLSGLVPNTRTVNGHALSSNVTVTKSDVSLGNVDNTSDANKPVSTAQATAIGVVQTDINTHEARTDNPHSVTKAQVGLANADNTTDLGKPISTATQTALNAKLSNITGLITDGTNVTITGTGTSGDPYEIAASGGGGGGGQVDSVVAGTGIAVDDSDPVNPEVSLDSASQASLALADSAVQDLSDLSITASAAELNLMDGVTASTTEINYIDGVTSALQGQLNGKEPTKGSDDNYVTDAEKVVIGNTSGTNTGDNATNTQYSGLAASKQDVITGLTASGAELNILDGATLTTTELNYVDGVTSDIQGQINGKANTVHTHLLAAGATDVTSSASELNVLDGITASTAELNYTDGVTSAIQTQIDGKQASDTDLTDISALTPTNDDLMQRKAGAWTNRTPAQVKTDLALVKGDVGLGNVDNTSDATKNSASVALTNKTIALGSNTISGSVAEFNTALTSADFYTTGGTDVAIADGGTGASTATAGFDALSPMTTAGDIIYGGASGTRTRLGIGTALQVLRTNAGATAPEWATIAGGQTLFESVVAASGGDYTTLGAAITAGKTRIFVRNGTYTETANITPGASVVIIGESRNAIIDLVATYSIQLGANANSCIANLTIKAPGSNGGVRINGAYQKLDGVYFDGATTSNFPIQVGGTGSASYTTITDCQFVKTSSTGQGGTCISVGANAFSSLHIDNCLMVGYFASFIGTANFNDQLFIRGCEFYSESSTTTPIISTSAFNGGTYGINIQDCIFWKTGATSGSLITIVPNRVIITGCQFIAHASATCVTISGTDCRIVGNTFSTGTVGVNVSGTPGIIDANHFATTTGITLGASGITVGTSNHFTSTTPINYSTFTLAGVTTVTSSATPTPTGNTKDNELFVTALAAGATFAAPTGTAANGNKLIIRIKDNATAQTLAYNAIYRAVGVTLPTTTVISKTMYLGFIYNGADTKWDCIAVAQEA